MSPSLNVVWCQHPSLASERRTTVLKLREACIVFAQRLVQISRLIPCLSAVDQLEIFNTSLQAMNPDRDWMLTRILWLSGKEVGVNRLGSVDTMRRYIYLHGCPDGTQLGEPGSIGCIRMANTDIIELFDRVSVGDMVEIN